MKHLEAIAQPTPFVCPDSRGPVAGRLFGSRALSLSTSHGFTLKTLQQALTETSDEALWAAVRALQEQAIFLGMLAMVHRREGAESQALRLDVVRENIRLQARSLRELAAEIGPAVAPG